MQFAERVELVQQPGAAEFRRRGNAHLAAHHVLAGLQRGFGIVDGLQRDAAMLEIQTPLVGQTKLARRAFEQQRM